MFVITRAFFGDLLILTALVYLALISLAYTKLQNVTFLKKIIPLLPLIQAGIFLIFLLHKDSSFILNLILFCGNVFIAISDFIELYKK